MTSPMATGPVPPELAPIANELAPRIKMTFGTQWGTHDRRAGHYRIHPDEQTARARAAARPDRLTVVSRTAATIATTWEDQ